ncbi:MAG: hypothetical protein MPN21_18410 [Thermoanaerobaculia bacterium]|nr:hypothetical protein [Thermoanaerobaculia bacterium]
MPTTLEVKFPPHLRERLDEAVSRLRAKVDAVYVEATEAEKMADLHYFVHELVDHELSELSDGDTALEHGALLDLRERVARHVHRLIESTRRTGD